MPPLHMQALRYGTRTIGIMVRCSGRPVPALGFLRWSLRQTPFDVPPRAAILSTGVAMSVVAHRERRRAAQFAAARIIRAMSATARPRTARASVPSPSQTGRGAAGRAAPSLLACWLDVPRPPATPCAVPREIAPSSARRMVLLRPRSDDRRFRPVPGELPGSIATAGPGPEWHGSPSLAPNFLAGPGIRQQPLIRRGRRMILFLDFRTNASLSGELERRLKEVHEQP